MSTSCTHSTALVCVECDAQLFVDLEKLHAARCPDPIAHRASVVEPAQRRGSSRTFGGQLPAYRSSYEVSADGFALIPFRRHDGEERVYECFFPWRGPDGTALPWMPRKPLLDADDVLFLTGMGWYAFVQDAARLPGKTAQPRQYETTTFVREYIFGDLFRRALWRRRRSTRRHSCIH